MKKFLLSWTVGDGSEGNSGRKFDFSWENVESILYDALKCSGVVTVDIVEGQDQGPQTLQVRTGKGVSVVTLGVEDCDGYTVRSYVNKNKGDGKLEILGDLWNANSICDDFNDVLVIFKEFLAEGDVSKDMLD